jgi:putative restriction endonuclease
MRRYWWVNHKKTSKHELGGGYLWSPKQNKNGTYNQFYSNMREASPGDFVFSFADATISYFGTIDNFASTSPRPPQFGKIGESWAPEGWYLPVTWQKLANPVKPKQFIDELRPLLPTKYSPLKSNGNGNEVYLAEICLDIFQTVMARSGTEPDELYGDAAEQLEEEIERQIFTSSELTATEISQLIKARRGQGQFRANVHHVEKCCRVTGVDSPYLLIASHIKPWRMCDTSIERLDGNNGLMLTPHVDLLFDKGYISFSNGGDILVSRNINEHDLVRLGLNLDSFAPRQFSPKQCAYLNYHRGRIFIAP